MKEVQAAIEGVMGRNGSVHSPDDAAAVGAAMAWAADVLGGGGGIGRSSGLRRRKRNTDLSA